MYRRILVRERTGANKVDGGRTLETVQEVSARGNLYRAPTKVLRHYLRMAHQARSPVPRNRHAHEAMSRPLYR
jgi:hypothetical protein